VVEALHVEVGDAPNDLVLVSTDQDCGSVLTLHVQGLGHFGQPMLLPRRQLGIEAKVSAAEQPGDGSAAFRLLPHRREQFRLGFFGQGPAHDLDGVARLDGLRLLAVAHGLDGHAGARLQFQQLEHGSWTDLAYLVDDQHRVARRLELARGDGGEHGPDRDGSIDAGVT